MEGRVKNGDLSGRREHHLSRRNPLVARLRALHQPKGRREQGLLLLEVDYGAAL